MTIAAGFHTLGGIVLCADTQESTGYIKWDGHKLFPYRQPWCTAGIVGAGNNAELIDACIEKIFEGLDIQYEDLNSIKAETEERLNVFFRDTVANHPSAPDDKTFDLLIGIKPKAGNLTLWKTNGPAIKTITKDAVVIGTGSLIRYMAKKMYRHDMPINHGLTLAIYLLLLAKEYVSGCGGNSHVMSIRDNGEIWVERVMELVNKELHLRAFESHSSSLMFSLMDGDISQDQFDKNLGTFAGNISKLKAETLKQKEYDAYLRKMITQTYPFDIQL